MAYRHENNYPEVVPSSYPEVLTSAEAYKTGGYAGAGEKNAGAYSYQAAAAAPPAAAVAGNGAVNPDSAPTPMSPAPPYHYPDHSNGTGAAMAPALPPVDERAVGGGGVPNGEKPAPTILGLKKKTFWIAIVILVIVIAAAVGGGVGGAAAAKNKSKDDDAEAAEAAEGTETSSSISSTPIATTTSTPTSTSTSTSASSTATGSSDTIDLGFDFEGWAEADFEGESTDIITPIGFTDFDFNITSYKWNPGSSSCCVTFCQGEEKNVGWRCTEFDREEASAVFSRIYVGCGEDGKEENSRCS